MGLQAVAAAYDLAARVHADQRRKGAGAAPYVNHPCEVALMVAQAGGDETACLAAVLHDVVEGARDGRSVADLMEAGAGVVTRDQCMEGVPEMIHDVQVEATFPDGTKLVTVHHPIR